MFSVEESSRSQTSPFYPDIRAKLKAYTNILSILDKVESDTHLSMLGNSLEFIFQKEMVYAVAGEVTRTQASQGKISFNGSSGSSLCEHSGFQRKFEANCY